MKHQITANLQTARMAVLISMPALTMLSSCQAPTKSTDDAWFQPTYLPAKMPRQFIPQFTITNAASPAMTMQGQPLATPAPSKMPGYTNATSSPCDYAFPADASAIFGCPHPVQQAQPIALVPAK